MLSGTVEGHLNVPRFYETLARILNERQTGIKVSVTVKRKEATDQEGAMAQEDRQPIAG